MAICPKNVVQLASQDLGVLTQERDHSQAHVSQRRAEPAHLTWRVSPVFWSIAACIPRLWAARVGRLKRPSPVVSVSGGPFYISWHEMPELHER